MFVWALHHYYNKYYLYAMQYVNPSQPAKQALLAFGISLPVLAVLCTAQFLWKYEDDVFGKGFDSLLIINFVALVFFSVISIALPTAVVVMASIYSRIIFQQGKTNRLWRRSFLLAITIAATCFLWNAYVTPLARLYMTSNLFSMQSALPNTAPKPLELDLFQANASNKNYHELGQRLDETENDINSSWERSVIVGKRIGILAFPVSIFVIFYIGFFLGILFHKTHIMYPLLVILLFVASILFSLPVPVKRLFLRQNWHIGWAELTMVVIYSLFALICFLIVRKRLATIENK